MFSTMIGNVISIMILILAVMTLLYLLSVNNKVKAFTAKIEATMNVKKHGTGEINPADFSFQPSETQAVERETMVDLMTEFDGLCEPYQSWTQMIPIFPLLGLLGTVLGLVMQVSAQDADAIFASLGVSLYTTLWGLVAAIALKLYDAFCTSNQITKAENALEKYERQFEDIYRKALVSQNKEEA